MHQRQRGRHRRVAQIAVIFADLIGQQHAFIDNGARRKRRHIEFLAMAKLQRLNGVAGALPDDVEFSFEIVLARDPGAARNKYLPNQRLDRDGGG